MPTPEFKMYEWYKGSFSIKSSWVICTKLLRSSTCQHDYITQIALIMNVWNLQKCNTLPHRIIKTHWKKNLKCFQRNHLVYTKTSFAQFLWNQRTVPDRQSSEWTKFHMLFWKLTRKPLEHHYAAAPLLYCCVIAVPY